jgi:hypothetical protein
VLIQRAYARQVCRWILLRVCAARFQSVERKMRVLFSREAQRTWRNPPRVEKQDSLLLFRLTSGLDGNGESIVALIRAHFKRLLMANEEVEEKQTTMTGKKWPLFELIEFHGSILESRKNRSVCVCVCAYDVSSRVWRYQIGRRTQRFICSFFFLMRCLLPSSMGHFEAPPWQS